MGFFTNAVLLLVVVIILVLVLPVKALHDLGVWIGNSLAYVANAVGNKIGEANSYNTSNSTIVVNGSTHQTRP